MSFTGIVARNSKPKEKPYKLFDSKDLYLYIPVSGKKVWRFKYRFNGKEGLITICRYSVFSLKETRIKRNQFLQQLPEGIGPKQNKN